MSIQTISGRHRVRRPIRLAGLRRVARRAVQSSMRLAARARRTRAGSAYDAELLTPAPRSAVRTLHLGSASIGYYGPTYTAAAPRIADEVRVARHLYPAHNGRVGIVVAITGTVRPVVVEVPTVGTLYCEPNELELIDRPTVRTLTMEAVVADATAGSGRAW